MGYFVGVPEQSLTLVGNSTSFEAAISADMFAEATSFEASFNGFLLYLQPEMVATATSFEASFDTTTIVIRNLIAEATPFEASFSLTYPTNEILYFDPAFEI